MGRLIVFTVVGSIGTAAAISTAVGPATAADFKGKTVEFTIPFSTTGGSNAWARFNTPFLQKYLPGQPTVVVRNVAGGGSTIGANQFAAKAKPTGLDLFGTSASTQFPFLLGDKRVQYDYKKWIPVLAAPTGGVAYISSKFGVKSVKELAKLKGQKLAYGSQGATSLDLVPLLGFRLLGLDVNHVFGMKGRGPGRLAFERGEATIDYQTTSAYLKNSMPLVKAGTAVPLFSWGAFDAAGNLIRDPNFKDLPHFAEAYEMVHGKKPSGIEWDVMKAFLVAGFAAQKLMVLPAGTPADVVEAYRAAVRKMRQDPEYKAKRDSVLGQYEQQTDQAGEVLYQQATTIAPAARAWVRDFLTKTYNVKF